MLLRQALLYGHGQTFHFFLGGSGFLPQHNPVEGENELSPNLYLRTAELDYLLWQY
jgi:hypothetical protein